MSKREIANAVVKGLRATFKGADTRAEAVYRKGSAVVVETDDVIATFGLHAKCGEEHVAGLVSDIASRFLRATKKEEGQ